MPDSGRWVQIAAGAYTDEAVFCQVSGVRLQRRYWEAADGSGPFASPDVLELDVRVARLRERWPDARRPDVADGTP